VGQEQAEQAVGVGGDGLLWILPAVVIELQPGQRLFVRFGEAGAVQVYPGPPGDDAETGRGRFVQTKIYHRAAVLAHRHGDGAGGGGGKVAGGRADGVEAGGGGEELVTAVASVVVWIVPVGPLAFTVIPASPPSPMPRMPSRSRSCQTRPLMLAASTTVTTVCAWALLLLLLAVTVAV
jgi:hypothetical protein